MFDFNSLKDRLDDKFGTTHRIGDCRCLIDQLERVISGVSGHCLFAYEAIEAGSHRDEGSIELEGLESNSATE